MKKDIAKVGKTIDSYIKEELKKELKSRMKEIRDVVLEEYHMTLSSVVTDPQSRTNPGLPIYEEAFKKELENFEIIKIKDAGLVLKMPDVDNFNWNNGSLKVIQNILEGTAGVYAEIDAEQYEKMYGKSPIGLQAFNDAASKKEMVYIIRYTSSVRMKEKETFGRQELVRFPFSNTPPINIFDSANKYVKDNIKDWMDAALTRALKRLKNEYRG